MRSCPAVCASIITISAVLCIMLWAGHVLLKLPPRYTGRVDEPYSSAVVHSNILTYQSIVLLLLPRSSKAPNDCLFNTVRPSRWFFSCRAVSQSGTGNVYIKYILKKLAADVPFRFPCHILPILSIKARLLFRIIFWWPISQHPFNCYSLLWLYWNNKPKLQLLLIWQMHRHA